MNLYCAHVAVIELASGEYGQDNVDRMVRGSNNGLSLTWFVPPDSIRDSETTGTDIQDAISEATKTT
jgi:hypothetical protein